MYCASFIMKDTWGKKYSKACLGHIVSSTVRIWWHPTSALLPEKSHGWRSLVGCSPWGCEESDTTEQLHFHFSLSRIGEGNGNPLQCSCLENPRDGGAWWSAVYGVAQSRTRLKWLSSSSSSRIWIQIQLAQNCLLITIGYPTFICKKYLCTLFIYKIVWQIFCHSHHTF